LFVQTLDALKNKADFAKHVVAWDSYVTCCITNFSEQFDKYCTHTNCRMILLKMNFPPKNGSIENVMVSSESPTLGDRSHHQSLKSY
jgi:hypothetical protein